MNMTKRDIADIVLVWMAVSFILVLLSSILTLGSIIALPDEQSKFMTTSVALVFQVLHLLVVAFLIYILLRRGVGSNLQNSVVRLTKMSRGIKGPAMSEVIKGIDGRLGEQVKLRKEIEPLRGKIIIEF